MKNRGQFSGFTIVELLIVIVVIAILAAITIVSYNGITSQARESVRKSDIATWKKQSEVYKVEHDVACPVNYSLVYHNDILGTNDFCVMKYEAKNDGTGKAISEPAGVLWTTISQPNAAAAAVAACDGCHLITDAEWMALVADIMTVKYNWVDGRVGGNTLYTGHNDNMPAEYLAASTDDEDGYYGTGNTYPSNQRRTFYLHSGDVVWDIAGNLWDRTSGSVTAQPGLPSDDDVDPAQLFWRGWTNPELIYGDFPEALRPTALATIPELADIAQWGEGHGLGGLYSNKNQTRSRMMLRGGSKANMDHAGVFSLLLNSDPTNAGTSVGFRAAR